MVCDRENVHYGFSTQSEVSAPEKQRYGVLSIQRRLMVATNYPADKLQLPKLAHTRADKPRHDYSPKLAFNA